MFQCSVQNLYIGKSNISLLNGTKKIRPTTIVGNIFQPYRQVNPKTDPDYWLNGGHWNGKTFSISPGGQNYFYITGIPLGDPIDEYLLQNVQYYTTFTDSHRTYLFQIR